MSLRHKLQTALISSSPVSVESCTCLLRDTRLLSLFSPNDTLEEISTSHLPFLLVPFLLAESLASAPAQGSRSGRVSRVKAASEAFEEFLDSLSELGVPWDRTVGAVDPARKREAKIAAFRREKDLKSRLKVLSDHEGSMYEPMFPPKRSAQEEEEEEPEYLREYILTVLAICAITAQAGISSCQLELELLSNAPPSPPASGQERQNSDDDNLWRLAPPPTTGPLLDSQGRPRRSFTILPSRSNRADVASRVFQPGHSLPTMTIDEYLDSQHAQGRVITGGGQASQDAPTTRETQELRAQMDGTRDAAVALGEMREKDVRWDAFTEANKKGSGNTLNRG